MSEPYWWLGHLATRLDSDRARISRLRSYTNGEAPLPEGADGCREAYAKFQRKARTNFGELVSEAVSDRMVPSGIRVGDNNEDDDQARTIWKTNRLSIWSADVHKDMLEVGCGYVCVQPGKDGPEITYQRPEQTIVDVDPSRPDKRRAGLMVYRDDVFQVDHAYLHLPGHVYHYVREAPWINGEPRPFDMVAGKWELFEDYPSGLDSIPIVAFVNRRGQGEYEPHLDLLDRINWGILQRLVITAMQAYRQRATKGDLPETDESGAPIDYNEMFKPGPGALWQLPDGVDLWESAQTDIGGILDANREDIKQLAAVTRTPMSVLMPDSQNQSATGAAFSREGLVMKTEDRINRAAASWSEVFRLAFALERGSEANVPQIDVDFLPPDRPTMAERYDALGKAGSDVPWRTKMTRILGFDGDEVDRMAAERAEDALISSLTAPQVAPGAETPVEGRAPENDDEELGDDEDV